MRIESLIKPTQRSERTVNVHGTPYVFTEIVRGRFVAEVADEAAQQTLLQHKKLYREFTDEIGPSLAKPGSEKVVAPPKEPKKDPPVKVAPPATTVADTKTDDSGEKEPPKGDTDEEIVAKAQALLSCTPVAIKKQLDKNCPTKEVLERAVAIEAGAEKPRDQVLAALRGAASALQD